MDTRRNRRLIWVLLGGVLIVVIGCLVFMLSGGLSDLLPNIGNLAGSDCPPGAHDGNDGLDTAQCFVIAPGESGSASLESLFEAHNWTFEGQAGQAVTIRVAGEDDTDPRAKLLDPAGNLVDDDDDGGGGWNALITATLPATGTYTIRVDVFSEGNYTVSVE